MITLNGRLIAQVGFSTSEFYLSSIKQQLESCLADKLDRRVSSFEHMKLNFEFI